MRLAADDRQRWKPSCGLLSLKGSDRCGHALAGGTNDGELADLRRPISKLDGADRDTPDLPGEEAHRGFLVQAAEIRVFGQPDPERIIEDHGEDYADSLRGLRTDLGLDRPFGTRAIALKLGAMKPVGIPAAATEEDPSEPADDLTPGWTLSDELEALTPTAVADEQLPGTAAEVPLDDLPF